MLLFLLRTVVRVFILRTKFGDDPVLRSDGILPNAVSREPEALRA